MTRLFAAALVAIALVVVSGCGGSSSSPSKPLTRAELTEKANTICKRVTSQVDWTKANPKTLLSVVDHLAALEEQAASELEKLTPPSSIADEWQVLAGNFRQAGHEFKQIAGYVASVPGGGGLLATAQRERSTLAGNLGIQECAKP